MSELTLTGTPTVAADMLIRRPVAEVFRAFADPAVTTRFWFTKSSGELGPGARVRWDWEMYGVSTTVSVKEFERDRRIVFEWNEDSPTTVEFRFVPWEDDTTFVQVTEVGVGGDGDTAVAYVTGSTAGFTKVLCAAKALLEHDVVLTVVLDHRPPGLEV
ncbi:SRPBCC family protein [Rugosimonospora africana]|uniref:Activator of HSP90 ATPase n=1 Tax=Rugosimonospora africana TaxID=556532 RepID=A0A8J3QUY2_9ACTN|nr:SRPBCC family protein [Rugosimonospora africana]GIH17283.1 activator of HSP90 ATPase [Rugosimonospora africana]